MLALDLVNERSELAKSVEITNPDYMSRNGDPFEFSLLSFVRFALRNRRVMLWIPGVTMLLTIVIVLVLPRRYTMSATFIPQTENALPANLVGLASQFGVALPGTSPGQSPEFYARLLTSRFLLRETVTTEYPSMETPDGEARDLVAFMDAGGDDEEERIDDAIDELREFITTKSEGATGMVTLKVTTTDPRVSMEIGSRMVELVDRFNVETRNSQASWEREFIEGQLVRTEDELREAEDDLEVFIRNNRQYAQSPELTLEHDRLRRELGMIQSVLTSLATSYERARMEEVRGTPVITIVEPAYLPARPDSRFLLARVILAGAATFSLGAVVAAARSALHSARENDPDAFASLRSAWQTAVAELLQPLRRFRSRRVQ